MYGSRAIFTTATSSGVQGGLLDVVDRKPLAGLHRLDPKLRDARRGVAVPGARPDGLAPLQTADPRLELGQIGGPEPDSPVRWNGARIRAGHDLASDDWVEQRRRAVRADELAADVVAVLAVREELDGGKDPALGRERRELRILELRGRLRRPLRRDDLDRDDLLAEEPARRVDLMDDRVGHRHEARERLGNRWVAMDVVEDQRLADRAAVERCLDLEVPRVQPTHEADDHEPAPGRDLRLQDLQTL